jgi:hypothetical protein
MRRAFTAFLALVGLLAAVPAAQAGSGVYDMSVMLGAGHPFASTPVAPPPGFAAPTLPATQGVGL